MALLMRLYDADAGLIQIGGRNITSIPLEELHRKFGVVFQNDVVFADSIYENIDFGRHLPPQEIERPPGAPRPWSLSPPCPTASATCSPARAPTSAAGRSSGCWWPGPWRARPEILILDDSSSALDYKTDAALRKALREEYQGITTIIIAQRVSSILHADHILVLEEGKELGYGTHQELLRSCPSTRTSPTPRWDTARMGRWKPGKGGGLNAKRTQRPH